MQRLQQQSADAPNEHRGIGMYPPDDIPLAKPSLAFSPDLGVLCLEVSGEPLPHSFGNGGARIWKCQDRHMWSVCG
jgi:hypothetical protein